MKQAVDTMLALDGPAFCEIFTDTKQVWIVDKISGLAKSWTLTLFPELNTDILDLTISGYSSTPGNDVLAVDTDQVEIDHENSRITVPVGRIDGTAIDPKEKIALKLTFALTLPEGATSTSKSSSHTYVTNTATVTVKTSNGQQSRSWTLYLKDKNAEETSDTSISNFSFTYTSKDNRMKLSSTVELMVPQAATMSLTPWGSKKPLSCPA